MTNRSRQHDSPHAIRNRRTHHRFSRLS
jgi:hypothetical protein